MSLFSTQVKLPILDCFANNAETFNLVIDKLVAYRYSVPEKILTVYLVGSAAPFFQVLKLNEFTELDERILSFYSDRYGSSSSLVQINTATSQVRIVMDKITNYQYGFESQLLIVYTTSPSGILAHLIDIDQFNDIDQAISTFYVDRYGNT